MKWEVAELEDNPRYLGSRAFVRAWQKQPRQWRLDWLQAQWLRGAVILHPRVGAPHAGFWHALSLTVQHEVADFSDRPHDDQLAQWLHEMRYVLSAHFADWVRIWFDGATDADKLAAYLARVGRLHYALAESARLHQKFDRKTGQLASTGANLKVLVRFHAEFILSAQGEFLLVDLVNMAAPTPGNLNGASFNYGQRNDWRGVDKPGWHGRLDVLPVFGFDGERKQAGRGYTTFSVADWPKQALYQSWLQHRRDFARLIKSKKHR